MNKLKNSIVKILSSHRSLLHVVIVLIYCLLYEWVNIFSMQDVKIYVNILKFILPFLLFLCFRSYLLVNFSFAKKYLFYFLLFLIWGLIPNVFSGYEAETMLQWSKFIIRFIFCYVIFAYLLQRPEEKTGIMKALVVIALGVVVQYLILSICYGPVDSRGFSLPIPQPTKYFGPFGLLGDGNALVSFSSLKQGMFRLTGFWFEASTASGFLFMSCFLAKALFEQTKQMRWRLFGLVCLGGGLLTFSNAGQFALGCAFLSGYIVRFKKKGGNDKRDINKMIALVILIFLFIFGRGIVSKYFPNDTNLRNLSGVRDRGDNPYSGRIEQLQYNKGLILDNPAGIGFRIMGIDAKGRGVPFAGIAPIGWFVCTGWIGLFLLLMRESQVFRAMGKRPVSSDSISIFQAWVVLFCQNLSLGTWMTPLYFLLAAMVFTTIYHNNDKGISMQGAAA